MKILGSYLTLRNDLGATAAAQLQPLSILSDSRCVANLPCVLKFNGPVAHGINGRVIVAQIQHHVIVLLLLLFE